MSLHSEEKTDGSILFQLGVLVVVLFVATAFINGVFVWRQETKNYMNILKDTSASILAQARSSMEAYSCLPWLLDYWQEHGEELDLTGDARGREADVASLLAGLGVGDACEVSVAQAQGLPSALQRRLAEHCYLKIHGHYAELKNNFGLEAIYCAVYAGSNTATPLFQGVEDTTTTANGDPYALGEEWPFDLSLHPALQESGEDAGDGPRFETVTSTSNDMEYLNGYLPVVIDGQTRCHICVAHTTAQVAEAIRDNIRMIELANLGIMVVSAAVLLWTGRSFLNKLALVQREVRAYRESKDTDAIVRGLQSVHANNEVGRLADDISSMAVELDRHSKETARLSAERERIDTELELAEQIQRTSLPNVFPPYPIRRDFGLFASMDAAKEAGGDFYDFFLVSENTLAVIVADVSGKGIPAALFMMRAMAAIKDRAMSGLDVGEVMTRANDELCANNEAGMFVTAWLGLLNLRTGTMEFVHAGHTRPALLRGGAVEYLRGTCDLIVGAQAGIAYRRQELRLAPGDVLFLYSDGVTEAFSADNEMYGPNRLATELAHAASVAPTTDANEYCKAICLAVQEDVDKFCEGAEQSDDITMLCLRYEKEEEQ